MENKNKILDQKLLPHPRAKAMPFAPPLEPEIHRVDPEFGSTLRLL
jgi:hypothetical protein